MATFVILVSTITKHIGRDILHQQTFVLTPTHLSGRLGSITIFAMLY